jgi:hypothetical protein
VGIDGFGGICGGRGGWDDLAAGGALGLVVSMGKAVLVSRWVFLGVLLALHSVAI